jgi:hypothetical protein
LYLPFAIAITLLTLAITTTEIAATGRIGLFLQNLKIGAFGLDLPIGRLFTEIQLFRATAIVGAIIAIIFALSLNIASLFPSELTFDVYYDIQGIRRKISELGLTRDESIKILPDWEDHLLVYEEMILTSLRALWHKDTERLALVPTLAQFRGSMSGIGKSTVQLRRIGLLHYRFVSSGGRVEFSVNQQKKARLAFTMEFHLRESPHNHVRIPFSELIPFPRVKIYPEYRQAFSIDSFNQSNVYDHALIVHSVLKVLPVPAYSDSIYLYEIPGKGYIPIGYCVYHGKFGF